MTARDHSLGVGQFPLSLLEVAGVGDTQYVLAARSLPGVEDSETHVDADDLLWDSGDGEGTLYLEREGDEEVTSNR